MTSSSSSILPVDAARIEREALAWLMAQAEGELADHEQAAFEAWLMSDPRARDAYEGLALTWDDVGEMKHLEGLASARDVRGQARWSRSWVFGATGAGIAVAAALALFVLTPIFNPEAAPQFHTEIASIDRVRLE